MSKPINALIGLTALAAIGGGALLLDSAKIDKDPIDDDPVNMEPVDVGPIDMEHLRYTIASVPCLVDAGVTGAVVRRVCVEWRVIGQYLACITDRQAIHRCEIARADLPDAAFRRLVVCDTTDPENPRVVKFAKLTEAKPPGWTCTVICPRILRTLSQGNLRDDLVECLEKQNHGDQL